MSDDNKRNNEIEELETSEWLYSLDWVLEHSGPERVVDILHQLQIRAHKAGVQIPFTANTPYINTIPREKQLPFPGNRAIERRIKSIIRWNAMAMVVKANKMESGIGTCRSRAAATTSRTFDAPPMLPGLIRRPSTPAASAVKARR